MSEGQTLSRQVRIEELASDYQKISQSLQESGLVAGQADELLGQSLQAVCVQCGLALSGSELYQLARSSEPNALPLASPKLQRVKQGYCGREGCNSFYYEIRLPLGSDVDWTGILESIASRDSDGASKGVPGESASVRSQTALGHKKRKVLLFAGLAFVVILLALKYMMSTGGLPGFQQEQKFQIDPNSIPSHRR
ncbi:MAG TPA: hypothetical protein P5186_02265 [Candidatus Paceibacterota bacterium]|nr:hypothetical protein [Verrucomicrobiota bacterium]HRY46847.1 hypothetical protein [Candidatus Paceibacterota bacterium]